MHIRVLTLLCVACLAVFYSLAQSRTHTALDPIDTYVRAEMQNEQIPGLALLIVRNGRVERAQGYGYANVELKVPVTPETLFQSGSMGKQFTAMAVMMLAEQGKLSLEDPLSRFFPEAPASWAQVKVKHLLSHTGGFTDYPEGFDKRRDYTEEELLKIVEAIPLAFPPGTDWSYSNLGYVTLGIVIHRVSGEFYGDLLREQVFEPLGMTTTRIISEAEIIPNRAAGYRLQQGGLNNQKWVSPTLNTTADGSLYFSILDLARWDEALREGKLIRKASYEQMWTPFPLDNGQPNRRGYGFGWVIASVNGHTVIEHEGAWQGFTTNISRYPDDKLTIAVLTNQGAADPDVITHHVAGLLIPALTHETGKKAEP